MTTLPYTETPETFAERQAGAAQALANLARWPHCQHDEASNVNDFDDTVRRAIDRGRAPAFTWSEYHDAPSSYDWQIFCQTVADAIVLERGQVEDLLDDARHRLENEVGKPSATDGSKGQWRASLNAKIQTYQWLLGEGDD